MCRRYQVSRSGFYAWEGRERSPRSRVDEELSTEIARIHRDSRGTYGSPRVHEQLKRRGVCCSNKRVTRLMREQGLRARGWVPAFAGTTWSRKRGVSAQA